MALLKKGQSAVAGGENIKNKAFRYNVSGD